MALSSEAEDEDLESYISETEFKASDASTNEAPDEAMVEESEHVHQAAQDRPQLWWLGFLGAGR